MPLNHRQSCSVPLCQVVAALSIIATIGCSGGESATGTGEALSPAALAESQDKPGSSEPSAESAPTPDVSIPSGEVAGTPTDEPLESLPEKSAEVVFFEPDASPNENAEEGGVEPNPSPPEIVAVVDIDIERVVESSSLDDLLADLEIPPPWLEQVQTKYHTSHPWKEARLEIRRLLGLGKPETHREAIKLTWLYLQKDDIGDGHEYPMYMFLGGEPLWAVKAFEWYIAKHDSKAPIYGLMGLAPLYARYGEYEKAKALLDRAMDNLPDPPWKIMRKADVFDAYGDLYAAWGKPDEAKRYYVQAIEWYPKAKPPYGGHLCPRRAAKVQSKLDLLTFRSLDTANLRDGQYQDRSLGYAGDIHVTLVVKDGKIADIELRHEEKIDQNACTLIPQRIVESQSLLVDGVSGATVTKDAIVDGAYRCLKKAGLE